MVLNFPEKAVYLYKIYKQSKKNRRKSKRTRKNAIVEYLDYQIPVTQLMGPKGNGDMQAAKRG